ncbi:protoporphyrinogen oxidase [Aurantimicrobium sp. MWH-Uga1]|uniref:protoporphyrinogen oxidase n=1 Tax=Aurantimicrobium sp. MWH-Uga1 TaxID=2079575 RepID=UPI000DED59E6|nr:protoporphyrinogen oxidase [Aurantimicrobium sp. MWH-Uga1]AXE53824.1 Protoporphyrinogen oxidase [Aurantimicrobium sp. MWH-Uga1]
MIQADRVVIGAGISGMLAALRATSRGETVVVLEKEAHAGGLIAPVTIGEIDIDAGAEAFSTAGESFLQLLKELGLNGHIVSPHRTDARIVASPTLRYPIPHGVLGIPSSLEDPELASIISPQGLEEARHLDSRPVGELQDVTVAELVETRLGSEFVDKLVDPLFSGVHGSSAHTLSAESTIPALLRALRETGSLCLAARQIRAAQPRPGAAVASLDGGMFTFVAELYRLLVSKKVWFSFNGKVASVQQENDQWRCETSNGAFVSTHLTIATGISTAAHVLTPRDSPEAEAELAPLETHSVDVALVILFVESTQLDSFPLGSGALITESSGVTAKASTHVNAKWEWVDNALPKHHHLIRLSYGRDGILPEGDLIALAHDDLPRLYQIDDSTIHGAVVQHWPGSLYQASSSAKELQEQLLHTAQKLEVELCGSYISGNGLLGITRDHYQRMTP